MVAGIVDRFSPPGMTKNRRVSSILQGQFHSISATSLGGILRRMGFRPVEIRPHAAAVPREAMPRKMRIAYLGSDIAYVLSLGMLNISPGVLLFAQKPR
jgi:hypothetical protein